MFNQDLKKAKEIVLKAMDNGVMEVKGIDTTTNPIYRAEIDGTLYEVQHSLFTDRLNIYKVIIDEKGEEDFESFSGGILYPILMIDEENRKNKIFNIRIRWDSRHNETGVEKETLIALSTDELKKLLIDRDNDVCWCTIISVKERQKDEINYLTLDEAKEIIKNAMRNECYVSACSSRIGDDMVIYRHTTESGVSYEIHRFFNNTVMVYYINKYDSGPSEYIAVFGLVELPKLFYSDNFYIQV